jgi:lysyl-tRNA synthetase class 2
MLTTEITNNLSSAFSKECCMLQEKYGFDEDRLGKRTRLIEEGVNPYPYSFPDPTAINCIIERATANEVRHEPLEFNVVAAGRIWSKRDMGRTYFVDLRDDTGRIQLYLAKDRTGEQAWNLIHLLDAGDIVGVEGTVFRTRTSELTIRVASLVVLAKAVVPIPIGKQVGDKVYYRVADPETKYRERYLHWLLNEVDRRRIRQRSKIISGLRRRMEEDGFLEVSTPTIESIYGGAEARPFRTSIWALGNNDAFLRISPELYLKRYLVAGFDKVFTICQNFRNEGIDYSHNPEFTMMEWYEAYTDYEFQMKRFESLVASVCEEICGSTRISYQGIDLDFRVPWERLTMLDALKKYGGLDASTMNAEDLRTELRRRGVEVVADDMSWGLAVVELFSHICEEHLVQPTFVIDHPVEVSPLTKIKRGDQRLVERFEPFVCSMEIGNAYSELTDPVDQLDRLLAQRRPRDNEQEYEDHPVDADFVKAIGCGMPPTGGVGLGVDRLIMLLTDAPSIRDIIPFPMLKPRT